MARRYAGSVKESVNLATAALAVRDREVIRRAVIALYGRQTEDEKVDRRSKYVNDRGFARFDGKVLADMAEKAIADALDGADLDFLAGRLYRYRRQIAYALSA